MTGRTPRTIFKCPICGHTNLTTDAMREHIKGKHYILDFELADGVVEVEIIGGHAPVSHS
jgi:transcription elongation factor Elf1